ncbi:MAG: transcription-repair coupling factor [Bacillota bacterium]
MKDITTAENLINIWQDCPEYQEIEKVLTKGLAQEVDGLPPLAQAIWAASLWKKEKKPFLLITPNEEDSQLLQENLLPLVGRKAVLFPSLELLPFEVYAHNIELISQRVSVLSRLARGENLLIVSDIITLSRRLAPADQFLSHHFYLTKGQRYDLINLAYLLVDMGYEREKLVQIPGTFSMRGSLLDIFPIDGQRPLRIEFFDDEVESLRYFDPQNQRSLAYTEELLLIPARELPLNREVRQRGLKALKEDIKKTEKALKGQAKKELQQRFGAFEELLAVDGWDISFNQLLPYFYPQADSLFDYIPQGLVIFSEPDDSKKVLRDLEKERQARYFDLLESGRLLPSFYDNFLSFEDIKNTALKHPILLFCQLPNRTYFPLGIKKQIIARAIPSYHNNLPGLKEDFAYFKQQNYQLIISASSQVRLKRIEEIIKELGFPAVRLIEGQFTAGFESGQLKLAVISEKELLAQEVKRIRRHFPKTSERIENFLDLQVGDYVVHISQGIGIYKGVVRLKVGENERDYLYIQYAGDDKLYLPVDQLDLIQKYIGDDTKKPKLYRLGGNDWQKLKNKVRHAVRDMAQELLQLYAAREKAKGYSFSPDTPWQYEFEDAFPYQETDDQLKALADIKKDMESSRPMDRLLCGDVGYGKTEIALRAAFKAVADGKQVAMLVPTTVLAQQHLHTFSRRFEQYPVKIVCLSRFVTNKELKQNIEKIRAGQADIIIGTHRLLSSDIVFKDLGLLIIDEEQRFGVAHKEKIKSFKANIDVLTLSATPIPRTLHMALVGMRDMSIIATPPQNRRPVQTYVLEYHQKLIKDIISRELSRGGQVYFVHNRVHNIHDIVAELNHLLPDATVAIAHGQMKETELERVMIDFVEGRSDILVSTTIIESGLDIPNVNTLIVDEANCFGLAQLYQLRGRVGRSSRQAFAYFTYRKDRAMTEIAKKRLIAIRDFTELGSGFKIAMRDMEIRGAGNILGPQQHGHIAAVGFDMYCRLLQEEITASSGKAPEHEPVNTILELQLNAYIPDDYLEDSALKVEIYKRIAAALEISHIDELAEELHDRYGMIPKELSSLLMLGKIKALARKLCLLSIIQKKGYIELKFCDFHPLKGEHLLAISSQWDKQITFFNKKDFIIKLNNESFSADATLELLWQFLLFMSKLLDEETEADGLLN